MTLSKMWVVGLNESFIVIILKNNEQTIIHSSLCNKVT
jgi:hypothetical protein